MYKHLPLLALLMTLVVVPGCYQCHTCKTPKKAKPVATKPATPKKVKTAKPVPPKKVKTKKTEAPKKVKIETVNLEDLYKLDEDDILVVENEPELLEELFAEISDDESVPPSVKF